MKNKAFAILEVVIVVGLLGIVGAAIGIRKGWWNQDTKRANESVQTTNNLNAAVDNQAAKAASVLTVIGEANATAPASKQRDFIGMAAPIGLSFLGQPDNAFTLQMRALENATLQGKLDEANKLNASLLADGNDARTELAKARAAKQHSDNALIAAADAENKSNEEAFIFKVVAFLAIALWAYVKITHTSPAILAKIATDIRAGKAEAESAIQAIDTHTTPLQQTMVKAYAWLQAKVKAVVG